MSQSNKIRARRMNALTMTESVTTTFADTNPETRCIGAGEKIKYQHPDQVPSGLRAYKCTWCDFWHGTSQPSNKFGWRT